MNFYIIAVLSVSAYAAADTQPIPYPPSQPANTYGPPSDNSGSVAGPYLQQYSPGPDSYNIQSGFEGYLVPSANGVHTLLPLRESLEALGSGSGIFKYIKPLTKIGLKIIPKIGALLLGVIGLFVIGGVFTTAVCSLTPICTISFLGLGWGFNRESMRSYLTQDKLSATAAFVMDAIKKYREMYETSSNEILSESEKKSRK